MAAANAAQCAIALGESRSIQPSPLARGEEWLPETYGTIFVTVLLLFASFDSGTMLPSSALILKA